MKKSLRLEKPKAFRIINKLKIPEWVFLALISGIFGLIWYLTLYGRFGLYFTHVTWIYSTGRDPLQHQLGWEFFRNEVWRFPLGTIKAYGYPQGTSVTFMDSIPLFALIFKLLSPLLDRNFQYLGLWELTSIIGQILVGMLIIREFTPSKIKMILGSSLLVLSPPMIYRAFFHSSLTAHWLILLAILFVILEYRNKLKSWYWILLFTLAMVIHLYFIPMLLPIWAISLVFRYRREGKKTVFLWEPLKIVLVILVTGFCIGIFELNTSVLSQLGFGNYSWNLNGFINSFGFSKYFPSLPSFDGQEEGFSYLGLGYCLILIISLFLFFIKDSARKNWKLFLPFGLIYIVYVIYSLSNKGVINTTVLWNVAFQDSIMKIFDLFRSSGRFIWPSFYFLVLFAIITLVRNFRIAVIPIFLIALSLQYLDLAPLYQSKQIKGFQEYGAKMDEGFWSEAGKLNNHIVMIPSEYFEHLVIYAVRHDMTISSGYFGRSDSESIVEYSQDIWNGLRMGISDSKTIYVLSHSDYVDLAEEQLSDKMYICNIDNYNVLFSADNALAQTGLLDKNNCLVPDKH